MDTPKSSNLKYYVIMLISFFLVLYLLDGLFGLHYEPVEHQVATGEAEEISAKNHDLIEPIEEENDLETSTENTNPEEVDESAETEKEVISADEFYKQLLAKYQVDVLDELKNKARTDVVIRYYRHPPDGNSAYALENLGFYIHERPVDPKYTDYQSNAIFYGDSVSLRDIQLVGFTLLKEGQPVKLIKPSKFGDSWKSKSIEIGTDTTLLNLPTLTKEDIQFYVR